VQRANSALDRVKYVSTLKALGLGLSQVDVHSAGSMAWRTNR